jgi:hypothetical protein
MDQPNSSKIIIKQSLPHSLHNICKQLENRDDAKYNVLVVYKKIVEGIEILMVESYWICDTLTDFNDEADYRHENSIYTYCGSFTHGGCFFKIFEWPGL